MPYINKITKSFGHDVHQVREAHPESSIPDGLNAGDFEWYEPTQPPVGLPGQYAIEIAPLDGVQRWELSPLPTLADRQASVWERIKAERDRRKSLGVKVGANWFHSDDFSRIQQLALVIMGASIPAGLQWKTLTLTPPPVFVEMTPALAQDIFSATAANDSAVFSVAEGHRIAMEASPDPEGYDFSAGWPATIYDAAT